MLSKTVGRYLRFTFDAVNWCQC